MLCVIAASDGRRAVTRRRGEWRAALDVVAGFSIQPSEFLKPAFVIICAWLFAEHARQPDIPGNLFAMILLGLVLALLVAQPDLGQTMLVLGTWGVMFFMAGMPWLWIIALGVAGVGGGFRRLHDLSACGGPHRPLHDRRRRYVPGRHGP